MLLGVLKEASRHSTRLLYSSHCTYRRVIGTSGSNGANLFIFSFVPDGVYYSLCIDHARQ